MKYTVHDKWGCLVQRETFRAKRKAIKFAENHPIATEVCVEVMKESAWVPHKQTPHAESVWVK